MPGLELNDDHFCFACGRDNPDGLKLAFEYPGEGLCRAEFTPVRRFQGWHGILHGGIISTLLDEGLAHAAGGPDRGGSVGAVTAEMTVKYLKPVSIGAKIILEGRVTGGRGRVIEVESTLRDSGGTLLASASGKLVRIGKYNRSKDGTKLPAL